MIRNKKNIFWKTIFILSYMNMSVLGFGPNFFVCNYHGRLDPLPHESEKLFLSVNLEGNPEVYVPGQSYTVKISSSQNFNGLLITGLFSSSIINSKVDSASFGMSSFGFSQTSSIESDFLCSIVYSNIAPNANPTSQVSFKWSAPDQGTGCVSFLLTASLGMQIVFQDVVSYQICEEGQEVIASRPSLADIHSDGVILRDDFDSESLNDIWSTESEGVVQSHECGEITHEKAAVFCSQHTLRLLVSPPLNLTSASALQFTLGSGTCPTTILPINVSFRIDNSVTWTTIKSVEVKQHSLIYIIHVPDEARAENVELKFSQDISVNTNAGCWALDNILITETEDRSKSLQEDMDPMDTSKWLFFPGAQIKGDCMSQGNAMVFSSTPEKLGPTYAVTRDLDLSEGTVDGVPVTNSDASDVSALRGACGHDSEELVKVFNYFDQYCTTVNDDLRGKVAVRFTLGIGSGECSASHSHDSDVILYSVAGNNIENIATFSIDSYRKPKQVSVPIPANAQVTGGILCLQQRSNSKKGQNVWSIDSFELIERPNEFHHFMQFSINMRCTSISPNSSVNVEYSNDFGRSWYLLQEECLPETCQGTHWPYNSVYKSDINIGWVRTTLPLPVSALGKHTRFRWILDQNAGNNDRWAIDNIYVGSDVQCPGWCSGRGTCQSTSGCRCDIGYYGDSCNITSHELPSSLEENFDDGQLSHSAFADAHGFEIGYDCGLIGTGKALVFTREGRRMLISKQLNGTDLKWLQFSVLMGRHSTVGSCQAPSIPGDGVLVHYTIDRGVTWHFLQLIPYNSERKIRVVSIALPIEASRPGLQVRLWQPNMQKAGKSVWAIDDIIISDDLYKSIYSTTENFQRIYSSSVSFHTGVLSDYCNETNVLLFTDESSHYHGEQKYAESQTMETSAGYVLEADLILKCEPHVNSKTKINLEEEDEFHEVSLEYSKDHGVTWHLVQEDKFPGSTSDEDLHPSSVHHVSEYKRWTKVTLPLPRKTWSSHLRIRIIQNNRSSSTWAVDNVYMGPACLMHCYNRGRCRNGKCICDNAFEAPTCMQKNALVYGVNDPFEDKDEMIISGWKVVGADVLSSAVDKSGCGSMPSSHYLHFFKAGVRKLVSPNLDLSHGGQIQFFIRIGGGHCGEPTERANGITLQYSNDGGVTWLLLDELYYQDYREPTYVHRDIPVNAMTKQTMFGWWQPKNGGAYHDQWSLGDVIVGEPMLSHIVLKRFTNNPESLKLHYRRSTDEAKSMMDMFIVKSNDGQSEDFCDPRSDSLVFNKGKGDRFATTDDSKLREGDTIQFEINIGCSNKFSWHSPVHLEFSHNSGYSWELVTRVCYPAGRPIKDIVEDDLSTYDCTGVTRELTEASIYHQGDFNQWTRVVLSVSSRVAALPVRFRWWQHVPIIDNVDSLPAPWAIRSVYIGKSCPFFCFGHGKCKIGSNSMQICLCDKGYTGEHCEMTENAQVGFWDHVTSSANFEGWWKSIQGVGQDDGCGQIHAGSSLYFDREGTRKVETVSLNMRNINMIQFHFRLGNTDNSRSCLAPEHKDESVLLQYSNNNGITWNLIKELSFDAFSSRSELVTINIPFAAKTQSTSFRWWQPLREEGEHRSQWALDEIFIGVSDLLDSGFSADFNNGKIDEKHWFKIDGEIRDTFPLCDDVDSTSKSLVVSHEVGIAETWDFHLNSGSFLQFDLVMSCKDDDDLVKFVLNLEYSADLGSTWYLVIPTCVPGSSIGCDHGLGSLFYPGLNQKWRRHTIPLPESLTNLPRIRFRWVQYSLYSTSESSSSWSIDNVYLGNGCPWMCGGHGYCWPSDDGIQDQCICDEGYGTMPYCEPSKSLPKMLLDNFDHPWDPEGKYSLVLGRELLKTGDLTSVGIMTSGENLQMGKVGIRMLETATLNTTDTKYIQFSFFYQGGERNHASTIVLQSTNNNGITWKTIHLLNAARYDEDGNRFVHLILPSHSRQPAVSFRWWHANVWEASPVFESSDEVWALENLVISGRASGCDNHVLQESFLGEGGTFDNAKNWLFHPGGDVKPFCESQGNTLVINRKPGEHSISTADLCISEEYVLQFKIAVGCSAKSLSSHSVRLEYSTDGGVTWSLVVPRCHANDLEHSVCSDELHPSSIYYPGAYSGWRRIVIPLDRHHVCSSVRFRWYQGFYADNFEAAKSIPWALDDVYIGPGCVQMCNGHGTCTDEGEKCVCDTGYSGPTCCDIIKDNPTHFVESFDYPDGIDILHESQLWSRLSGGDILQETSKCEVSDATVKQWIYKVVKPGERVIETRDLDLRNARSIQFYLNLNLHSEQDAKLTESNENIPVVNGRSEYSDIIGDLQPVDESFHLQFSNDGGLRWTLLTSFPFISSNLNESQYIALHLPEASRSNATRFRWWHPMKNGKNDLGFSVDHIVIGGSSSKIDDNFISESSTNWLETSGAVIKPKIGSTCCRAEQAEQDKTCPIMEFGDDIDVLRDCSSRFAVTNDVNVTPGSFLSFNLHMNCNQHPNSCEEIELQYSNDLGHTWLPLVTPCYPNNPQCIHYYQGSTFYSDVYPANPGNDDANHIIIPLPEYSWSPSTRFRWLQSRKDAHGSWWIDNVYIGMECSRACGGRGQCHDGQCICNNGWAGITCQSTTKEIPSELKEVFSGEYAVSAEEFEPKVLFSKQVGGQIDNICGEVGFDQAVHFFNSCSRLLETIPLNTTKADFVQFMFRAGCGASPPSERNHGILVDYSTNGGIIWHNLAELYFENYSTKPGFVNILLPDEAKALGTQFRWWQPKHSGLNQNDWALDNLLISGKREEQMLSDDFSVAEEMGPGGLWLDRGDKGMWQFYDNTEPNNFCGRDNVILAGTIPGLDVTVSTKDFLPEEGFIVQYTIVVLCEDIQVPHQPVHVQYSTDFGDTWNYLVTQCIPSDKDCFGKEATQPSAHFISPDWRRKTIWLPSSLFGKSVRFRFHQEESDVMWALDRLFIGPACTDACSGHGDCVGVPQLGMFESVELNYDDRNCLCDYGYGEPNCYLMFDLSQHYLKDDFNEGMSLGGWFIVEAEKHDTRCGLMVDGHSLAFDGVGPRQAETRDLDLRDARFVQYNAVIGGSDKSCFPAKSRGDGLLLQYSTDGGSSWEILHSLDYSSYPETKHDYVPLPPEARTNATRIRWWQPFSFSEKTGLVNMGYDRAGWALDNIYIGGQEVNTYTLEDDFEVEYDEIGNPGTLDEELYEFYPNGMVALGQCPGDDSSYMTWPGGKLHSTGQSLTTRQLIVTPGHMIQFKIKVGCGDWNFTKEYPINLAYREDPRYNEWQLVKTECYPGKPSHRCPPYFYHDPSIYTLKNDHIWTRVTIPLDEISSGTTQFRWLQEGGAPAIMSWAVDDLYVGESCPGYCSGHGRCTKSLQCICDVGYLGEDCSRPIFRYVVPIFRDNFEHSIANHKHWQLLTGGILSKGGCGPLRPFGFSRSVYFAGYERRQIVTREMDLTRAWHIQYVIQVGSVRPTKECHVNKGDEDDESGGISVVLLQYSTDNGISWHSLREHSSLHYGVSRRVSQSIPTLARSVTTILRWWQPFHRGAGEDQWALDNVEIVMSRRQMHLHLLDYSALLRRHSASRRGHSSLPNNFLPMEIPEMIPVREKVPPGNMDELP